MDYFFSEKLSIENYNGIHLLQDHIGTNFRRAWDDYDYTVKFQVFYVSNKEKKNLGNIRLLIKDCFDTAIYLKEHAEEYEEKINSIVGILNHESAVSLPLEIDYYSKLHKLFDRAEIENVLSTLCDASYFFQDIERYKGWPGFDGSLMREGSKSEALLRKGAQIAMGGYAPKEEFKVVLDKVSPTMEEVEFYFNSTRELGNTNVNLLIGENGVGKTFVLKYLCDVVSGLKRITEPLPYFHKLIVVSYSPFESFDTKSQLIEKLDAKYQGEKKKKTLASQRKRRSLNVNEYALVGFRDELGEFDLEWPKYHSVESLLKILEYDVDNSWWDDDARISILKSTLAKSISFDDLALLSSTGDLIDINNINRKRLKEIGELVDKSAGIIFLKEGERLKLSSGQQIYSHMLPAIVAEIEDESLLIIDEPELYLHPSLEVGLLNMLKHLLNETKSYAVIATHSAVITREVEKQSVSILRRVNGITTCSTPSFETFGESLELIMGEAFDDFETSKPYQAKLNEILDKEDNPIDFIKNLGESLGDEALSYALSKVEDNNLEIEDE